MDFARLGTLTLHYRYAAAPQGRPVVVLVNSLGTDMRIWDAVADALGGEFGILCYDKRGHGLSDLGTPPYTMKDHADDLEALLDSLGIGHAVFCGLSVGGQIVQELYARAPRRVMGIVFSNTAPKIGEADAWAERIETVSARGMDAVADGVLERWFSPRFRQATSLAYPGYRNMLLRQPPQGYAGTCAAIRDFDMREAAGDIGVPVACIGSENDGATPPALVRDFAAAIPGALYFEIEDAGHLPCIEAPERVSAIIRDLAGTAWTREQGA